VARDGACCGLVGLRPGHARVLEAAVDPGLFAADALVAGGRFVRVWRAAGRQAQGSGAAEVEGCSGL